jgi:hypothetical protein
MEINNIYKVRFENNYEKYYGVLRNEKNFNLGDNVFISYGNNSIFRGIIKGIEIEDALNPNIFYKIEIPEDLVYDFEGNEETSLKLTCKYIFNSLDDAKESRIKQLNKMHKLELESIEKFFNQFKEDNDD